MRAKPTDRTHTMRRNGATTNALLRRPFRALASDGDGTLTTRKILARSTLAALDRWQASGRKLILATGETTAELKKFPALERFDLVVAENGALLYWPRDDRTRRLAVPPPLGFVQALRRRRVPDLILGETIVSTKRPHDRDLQDVIAEEGIDWVVLYNRQDAMALPPGVDKAFGLRFAAAELGLSCEDIVAVGDAENDIPLVCACGMGVAVATAVPALKRRAAMIVRHGSGAGVVELIRRILPSEASRRGT
jgi:hydroxymethylpyrimidine pyrophosphatase-like HAD family hydrolase